MNDEEIYTPEQLERRKKRAQRIAQMKKEKEERLRKIQLMKKIALIGIPAIIAIAVMIIVCNAVSKNISKQDAPSEEMELAADTDGSDETVISANEVETISADAVFSNSVENSKLTTEETGPYAAGNPEKYNIFPGYTFQTTDQTEYLWDENVISTYGILVDLDTGEIVAQKNAGERISPASMTKILTVLVAAEHVTDLEDPVTITIEDTDFSYSNDCSAAGFEVDEVVPVKDLFYGTILPSGGDAAHALACYVAGSQDAFVEMMNQKLEELGISDTAHFTNCVGLYDENHYCTVEDMAVILKAAVENDLCREVLSTHIYTTTATPQHENGIELSNWFLRRIEDKDSHGTVLCAKTGFVNQSRNCAASYTIANNGKQYICVTADSTSSWRCIYDHVQIYQDYLE